MYVFDKRKDWKCDIIKGRYFEKKPLEIFDKRISEIDKKELKGLSIGTNFEFKGKLEYSVFDVRSWGSNHYLINGRYIVNYIIFLYKGEYVFGAEVFDTEMVYRGFYRLDKELNMLIDILDEVLFQDKEGYIYMRKYINGIPCVMKIKINISVL